MPRMVDWLCACGRVEQDCLEAVDATRACPDCHAQMQQDWLPRVRRDAQWDDRTAVLVHVNPTTGDVRYPGQHSAKLKDGYERVYLRDLQAVNKFERDHHVLNQVMHYDRNGRDPSDNIIGSH